MGDVSAFRFETWDDEARSRFYEHLAKLFETHGVYVMSVEAPVAERPPRDDENDTFAYYEPTGQIIITLDCRLLPNRVVDEETST